MKGHVLDYSVRKNEGVISAADGRRYTFSGAEWKGNSPLVRGMGVDFEVQANKAVGIYQALGSASKPGSTSKGTLVLLAVLLGGVGAHKFYMGSWGWGIVYLVLFWTAIPLIASIIEWIRYVLMSDDEFYKKVAEFQAKSPEPFSFFW